MGRFWGRDNRLCCLWYSIGLGVCGLWVSMFDVFWVLFPLNKLIVKRNDDDISASPHNIGIYMILFEQNCNNLKMAAIGQNM